MWLVIHKSVNYILYCTPSGHSDYTDSLWSLELVKYVTLRPSRMTEKHNIRLAVSWKDTITNEKVKTLKVQQKIKNVSKERVRLLPFAREWHMTLWLYMCCNFLISVLILFLFFLLLAATSSTRCHAIAKITARCAQYMSALKIVCKHKSSRRLRKNLHITILSLFGVEIIFEVFQQMWSRYLNVTDGQTDGQYCGITAG